MTEPTGPRDAGSRIEDAPTLLASLAAGRAIGDRYEVSHLIARGGFGEVYRARDTLLERECAIKILAAGAAVTDDSLLQEARTAAKLEHPNIVPVYDVGRVDGRLWIAMRLVDGEPLNRALASAEHLPLARVTEILAQAADAIAHAHRRGIIHRDVKPQNLLIEHRDGGDHVWLTDFGIATVLQGAAMTPSMAGTPGYMAPEQISGRRVDARTDIFALGCIAYELFTGGKAFSAESYSELVYKVVHTDPPDFAEAARRFGPEAEAFLRKALAKSPDDRYATMEEAALALRRLAGPERKPSRLRIRKLLGKSAPVAWSGHDVVVARNLRKRYGFGRWVLDGASFQVDRGAIYALLGRNGSGKTTAIRTTLGLYARNGGEVRIFGRDPQRNRTEVLSRVGYVPESFAGYDSLRVVDYLALVARFYPDWDQSYCNLLLGRYALP
ncbi:MAG TPA: protein kinase, partial [Thermoanaerobaculia bacterium]|nr:protein kinase [Thermoanaerobaculia bacterium]